MVSWVRGEEKGEWGEHSAGEGVVGEEVAECREGWLALWAVLNPKLDLTPKLDLIPKLAYRCSGVRNFGKSVLWGVLGFAAWGFGTLGLRYSG